MAKKENNNGCIWGALMMLIGIIGLGITYDKPFGIISWIFLFIPLIYWGFLKFSDREDEI
jgi:hypothetical protein